MIQTVPSYGGSGGAVPIPYTGDGVPVLITNLDSNNTVYFFEDTSVDPNDPNRQSQLPPLASIVLDGSIPEYAICAAGDTAEINCVQGGINFFQLVELLIKTLIIEASAGNGIYVYSGVPGLGDLIASITSGAGTDPEGNPVPGGGVIAYTTVTGTFAGTYAIELANQTQVWGAAVAALLFQNITNPGRLGPAVTAQVSGTAGANLNLQSGLSTLSASGSTIQVQDSVSSGQAGGLVDIITGALTVLSQTPGDLQTYDTQRATAYLAADLNSNGTTGAQTILTYAGVGIGTYRIHGVINCEGGQNAGAINFSISGTATPSHMWVDAKTYVSNDTGQEIFAAALTGFNQNFLSTTMISGATTTFEFDGIIQFSAAGTLTIRTAQSVAADTYVNRILSFADLEWVSVNNN
jgi:hypothetical protein